MKTYAAGSSTPTVTTDYVSGFVYENGNLNFFASPEGRVVKKGSTLEYQYAIADHLGNTRVVFSSVNPSNPPSKATFENITNDANEFSNINSSSMYWVSKSAANNTPSGQYVIRMNNSYQAGPAKSLKVYPGDVVDMEVWSYFEGGSGFGGTNQPLTGLITSVAGAFGGVSGATGESGLIYSGVNAAYTAYGSHGNLGDVRPTAYLNYILLDRNYKLLDMGWKPVPETANMSKQRIYFDPIKIKEAGFMYVYLSYEGEGTNWVYFDDLSITHTKTNVIQYNEYYPHGLQTNMSWTRENSKNDFLYNAASELNQTSGWYEMFYRNYDPAIARFTGVDPLASDYASFSSYHYAYNNPVRFNDPTGAAGIEPGPAADAWAQMMFAQGLQEHMAQIYAIEHGPYSNYDFNQDQGVFNHVHISSNSPIIIVIKNNDPYDLIFRDGVEQGTGPKNSTQGNPNARYYDSYEEYMKQYSFSYNYSGHSNGGASQADFFVDNNNQIGLGMGILEPSFGQGADDAIKLGYVKGATNAAKGVSYGLTVANVALSTYVISKEIETKQFNTHSVVNAAITTIGTGLAIAGVVITAPAWGTGLAIGGAVLGIGYGVAQMAGFDEWVDEKTDNWGKKLIE